MHRLAGVDRRRFRGLFTDYKHTFQFETRTGLYKSRDGTRNENQGLPVSLGDLHRTAEHLLWRGRVGIEM